MAQVNTDVSIESAGRQANSSKIPAWFNEYVLVCRWLKARGVFEEINRDFRLPRSGYQVIDALVVGLAYFSAQSWYSGVRGLLDDASRNKWSRQLAGAAGRKQLCSQASMSRLLDDIPRWMANEMTQRLLVDYCPAAGLLDYEEAMWRDCRQRGWHGFALDNRVQPLRRRGLPDGQQFPPADRLVDNLGARSGYSGRKRADVQMTRSVLEHLGSGLYRSMAYRGGNGALSEDFVEALDQIEQWAATRDIDPERCFLAIDGDRGGEFQVREGLNSPVRFVTRFAHYTPLKSAEFRAALADQSWQRVKDSKSGPTRWATEMGTFRRGSSCARLVVSCLKPADGQQRGAGYQADGLHYEVFACDLDAEAFPASEVVTLYYGRAGRQENNFQREDRRMNLERIFSDNPAGQQLMMAVGMWMRNARAVLGSRAVGSLETIEDTGSKYSTETGEFPFETSPTAPENESVPDNDADVAMPVQLEATPQWWQMATRYIDRRLEDREGFEYDPEHRLIRCPDGASMKLSGCRRSGDENVRLRFRINSSSCCRNCPFRNACTSSTRRTFRKEIGVTVPLTLETPDDSESPMSSVESQDRSADESEEPSSAEPPADETEGVSIVDIGFEPYDGHKITVGQFEMTPPRVVTSHLRNVFEEAARQTYIEIDVSNPAPDSEPPDYLVTDCAERQHRRQTWEDKIAWNALPDQATVQIRMQAPSDIHSMIATLGAPPARPGG